MNVEERAHLAGIADEGWDLVPRLGQRLAPALLLDAATLGNWIDVEFTIEAIQASTAYARILVAMTHLVAARRRLRLGAPALPPGAAREQAVRLALACGELVGDLRALIAPGAPDPTSEAARLCRLGDSLHHAPAEALACYEGALRLIPDHAPAHFGVFIVRRLQGDSAEAAYHLYTAVQYAPGNAIYRYYYNTWRLADPKAAAVLPSLGGEDGAIAPPAERVALRALRRRRAAPAPSLPPMPPPPEIDPRDPEGVRALLDALLEDEHHNLLLAMAFHWLGRIDARAQTQSLGPSQRLVSQLIASVVGLAHQELALGALEEARALVAQEGCDVRTRTTTLDLCIQRLQSA